MEHGDQPILIYTTFASQAAAETVGEQVVSEELAACVNILPGMVSIYRWKGALSKDAEVVMLVKSRARLKSRLVERLGELHPYEVPVLFVIEGEACGDDYRQWLMEMTGAGNDAS